MNSTPAASKARRRAKSFATVIDVWASVSSARRIVVTPRVDSRARASALQRRRARAALICALVRGFSFILTYLIPYDINHTERVGSDRIDLRANAIFQLGERCEIAHEGKILRESALIHRRLRCPDHHGR